MALYMHTVFHMCIIHIVFITHAYVLQKWNETVHCLLQPFFPLKICHEADGRILMVIGVGWDTTHHKDLHVKYRSQIEEC